MSDGRFGNCFEIFGTVLRRKLCVLLLIPLSGLFACGTGLNPPATSYVSLNGNWEAVGTANVSPPVLTSPIAAFTGALQSSGGTVTGTLRAFDINYVSPCVPFMQALSVTGTLSASGTLVLRVPIAGGTATLNATLSSPLETYTQGSWQISGGACAMASTPMALAKYAPVTGTYSGTLTSLGTPAVSSAVTAVLTQSTTPDSLGQFPLTGTVTSTGVCTGSRPLLSEIVSGNGIFPVGVYSVPGTGVVGVIQPTATNIVGGIIIDDPNCPLPPGLSGTLTRQ